MYHRRTLVQNWKQLRVRVYPDPDPQHKWLEGFFCSIIVSSLISDPKGEFKKSFIEHFFPKPIPFPEKKTFFGCNLFPVEFLGNIPSDLKTA
jgi:hypothetical protein